LSSSLKNLSEFEGLPVPSGQDMRIGIVVSEWNHKVTEALKDGARQTLINYGCPEENIQIRYVPGSFELTLGAQYFAEYTDVDAIICLGCVIQGETRHFDFICDAVANGVTNVSIKYNRPVIFGVLTPHTMQQALDRSGGKHGNKGDEAAITALKMVALKHSLK